MAKTDLKAPMGFPPSPPIRPAILSPRAKKTSAGTSARPQRSTKTGSEALRDSDRSTLDGFEYDGRPTRSARQIFAPSTAEAAIVVGYNSGVPPGRPTTLHRVFGMPAGTISPIVDRPGPRV